MHSELNEFKAKQQYFELRKLLNQANPLKNQVTELEFELREEEKEFSIIIKSSGAKNGLRTAYYKKQTAQWYVYQNEKFQYFYDYLFTNIKNQKNLNNVVTQLTGWLSRLWII